MGSMESSLRSKDKASRECCQAIGRDVRIIHHRESLYPLFLPFHGFRRDSCGQGLRHHIAADDLAPVLRQPQALEQVAKLLVHQVDAHHQVAASRTGKTTCFGCIAVVLPPVVGRIARITAQLQTAMDTGDIACKLILYWLLGISVPKTWKGTNMQELYHHLYDSPSS